MLSGQCLIMNPIEQTWLAVVNLHAGSGKTASLWREAEQLLVKMGICHDNKYTDYKYHAAGIAYRAAAKGFRRFIAVGGDGTIHEVLEGIMKYVGESAGTVRSARISDFTLAVIPIGSGNDWIRIHGIHYNMEETVSLIRSESFIRQDVVKVSALPQVPDSRLMTAVPENVSYMMNIGGVGFDARVCERVNMQKAKGMRGKLLYINALLYLFLYYRSVPMAVFLDGERVFEGNCFSVALGTGKYCGGGLRQTPDAVFDDGLLDLTVIPQQAVGRVLLHVARLFDGRFTTIKGLVCGRGRCVTVVPRSESRELIEVDGEIIGNSPVRFEVLEDRINVLHDFTRDPRR